MQYNDKAEKILNDICINAQKLQELYYENERFYDRIKGADGMDNAKNWPTDLRLMLYAYTIHPERVTEDEITKEMRWVQRVFRMNARVFESRGAGTNGSARGIRHEEQFPWVLSANTVTLVTDLANEMKIAF